MRRGRWGGGARRGRIVGVAETAQVVAAGRGGGAALLKVAVPVFAVYLIKTGPVPALEGLGGGGREEGGRKVGQGASLIRSRKASQIDLSKTMAGLLRNINPHSFNIEPLCHRSL